MKIDGWAKPLNSKKWHFFAADRRSLCGRWAFFGWIDPEDQKIEAEFANDCRACARKLEKNEAPINEGKRTE